MYSLRRFIAADWPLKLWFAGAGLLSLGFLFSTLQPEWALLSDGLQILIFIALVAATLVAGLLTAGIFAVIFIGPIYALQTRFNGGPFVPGDRVQVLSGPFAGRRSLVYMTWQGNSVRVDLGEPAKNSFHDIFAQHQLLRVKKEDAPPS